MRNKTTKCAVERVERPSNRRLLRHELKLFASTLSRVLCYYESNSTIVVARSSRRGADAGEDWWKVESARVQGKGALEPAGWGGAGEQSGGRGIHPRSIPGVAALTVKGVLRYESARENARARRRERMRDSDEFRILETLRQEDISIPIYVV